MTEIPAHLQPKMPEQDVTVPVEQRIVITDEMATAAAKILHRTALEPETLKALKLMGDYTESMGIPISRGRALVTQADIDKFINRMAEISMQAADDQVAISAAAVASSLFGRRIMAETLSLKLHEAVIREQQNNGKKKNKSFTPGSAVQINITNTGEKPVDVSPTVDIK